MPEQPAQRQIDANLQAPERRLQVPKQPELTDGIGVALRQCPVTSDFGSTDYLLDLDTNVVFRFPSL